MELQALTEGSQATRRIDFTVIERFTIRHSHEGVTVTPSRAVEYLRGAFMDCCLTCSSEQTFSLSHQPAIAHLKAGKLGPFALSLPSVATWHTWAGYVETKKPHGCLPATVGFLQRSLF